MGDILGGMSVQETLVACTTVIIITLYVVRYLVDEEMATNINKRGVVAQVGSVCLVIPIITLVASLPLLFILKYVGVIPNFGY